ncbi:MAG: UDP-N-acetylglucosamine 1-carboxyvinyltransferase [Clostridia bacterium]|nr:UDP-N-acetylglucosamine 1-carboxyvinyltransferase [Clostridia bacterium]
MGSYVICGGNKLDGSIKIESAKNSVLALIAGAVVCDKKVVIRDCPKINDVLSMLEILTYLGVEYNFNNGDLEIDSRDIKGYFVPKELTKKLRSSTYFLGALLSKFGMAEISFPGGCDIGKRPIDLHLSALKCLGFSVDTDDELISCKRTFYKDSKVIFPIKSVGATINVILACVKGRNRVTMYNCAKEPEIKDLADFLNSMGAKIWGAGTSRIVIQGVKELSSTIYKPIADRIELGTYLLAGALVGGNIQFCNVQEENINILLNKIINNSCKMWVKNDIMKVKFTGSKKGFNLRTAPFPGFPTDLQPQTVTYLSLCRGEHIVKETLFENRFSYVKELRKFGAEIIDNGDHVRVIGVDCLSGARVCANDLRGGAALVLAGVVANGETVIDGVEHIERGYLDMPNKLKSLGVNVKN